MAKTLTLSLNKNLIIEAVKADTYITGLIDKSADGVKNAPLAYNEQAGDDTYHQRKLTRTLAGAVGSLEANLAEFVDSATDNGISDTLASAGEDGAFNIVVLVSDRYNNGLAFPIAQLSQEYVVNKMLYYWWQSIRPALAKDYLAFSSESLSNIRLCLAKKAPSISEASYEDVTGDVAGGDGGTTYTVAALTYNSTSNAFVANYQLLLSTFTENENLKVTCSDPNTQLDVKIGTEKLFSIGYLPYNISQNNMFSIIQHIGTETEVHFVPKDTPTENTVLIFTSKTA